MALATHGLRFRETMAGYMSPAGSFRAGYRWGKVAGGDVRFTATIAIPDLDSFLQDPEHQAPLTARLDYDGLGWGLPVKAGRFHLFCRRNGHTRMLYYLPFSSGGQQYLLFGQKFVGDRPGLHVWRDLTSLHTQLLRLDESGQPVGEPLAKGILTIGLPSVLRQLSTFRALGATAPPGNSLAPRPFPDRIHAGAGSSLRPALREPAPALRAARRGALAAPRLRGACPAAEAQPRPVRRPRLLRRAHGGHGPGLPGVRPGRRARRPLPGGHRRRQPPLRPRGRRPAYRAAGHPRLRHPEAFRATAIASRGASR